MLAGPVQGLSILSVAANRIIRRRLSCHGPEAVELDWAQVGSLMLPATTAFYCLATTVERPGEKVLIHGATPNQSSSPRRHQPLLDQRTLRGGGAQAGRRQPQAAVRMILAQVDEEIRAPPDRLGGQSNRRVRLRRGQATKKLSA